MPGSVRLSVHFVQHVFRGRLAEPARIVKVNLYGGRDEMTPNQQVRIGKRLGRPFLIVYQSADSKVSLPIVVDRRDVNFETTSQSPMSKKTPDFLSRKLMRRIIRDGARPHEVREAAFRQRILSIPEGKVATYGQVAAASGYPLYHRAVARFLRITPGDLVPWHRVVGAGGAIKLRFEAAAEQRFRLELEGVKFSGRKVNLAAHQYIFGAWDSENR